MPPRPRRTRPPVVDGPDQHRDWLSLVEVEGPFLTLPVLTRVWPTLDAIASDTLARLRDVHAYLADKPSAWVEFVVGELLGWSEPMTWAPQALDWTHPEHEVSVACDFAFRDPTTSEPQLLGYVVDADQDPRGRVRTDDWPAPPVDRAAAACRALDVPLALVTNGRLWHLVWAPRGGATTVVGFDTATWDEAADRVVVRAFVSMLGRPRFTSVVEGERLPALLQDSLGAQEEITEALGVQVRRAVEQLVESMGRWDAREAGAGRGGLAEVSPGEVYAGAVSTLMRLVFLLFAEERALLPADNPVYAAAYGAGPLCERLEADAQDAGEETLEHRGGAWAQLLATSLAVHRGVDSARLRLPAYDGSLFDPAAHQWLTRVAVDDRTLLHVLRSVQYVVIKRERRRVSFRTLEVEQIGYVYEGLLAYDAVRTPQWVLGLIGKPGLEEELPLPELERLLAAHTDAITAVLDHVGLAADLAERHKTSGIGSVARLTGLLAPVQPAERSRRLSRLLAVTEGDRALAERVLPLFGILRSDLRGLPAVVPAGSLYVTSSGARASSGTHYTPRLLAEQVTDTALLPLVHGAPGPLDTDDPTRWVPASSAGLLGLRVADIAMGSGAFLVAACRFLAEHLVSAWAREGDPPALEHQERLAAEGSVLRLDGVVPEVVTRARRAVIEHCLYGVDVNPMAVEMAKLSLWLVSMDAQRPFTFLDDRLLTGDSLLGVASVDQIEWLHLDPAAGRRLHGKQEVSLIAGVRTLLADLATERRAVAELPGDTLDQLRTKRDRLATHERLRWRADLLADLVVSGSLGRGAGGTRALEQASRDLGALAAQLVGRGADSSVVVDARARAAGWLATDLPEGAEDRRPFHWPLRFPEVFGIADAGGGFDAVVGNPPFLGGKKITGALGTAYRTYLLHAIGRSVRGNADLVAYFVLRAHELLNPRGQAGLVATNTLAQGDTREVGLDQLTADGVTIRAAVKSEPWPARSAVLEYSALWTSKAPVAVGRVLDGLRVRRITPSLDAGSRASGTPVRLNANRSIAFQGSVVLGMGFVVAPDQARQWIEGDSRNAEVLFPYLNGEDLNGRPDASASRWVINFHNWSEERARSYPVPFAQVQAQVKPQRDMNKKVNYRSRWWQFGERCPGLYAALGDHRRAIAITLVSKVVMPVMVPTGQVFSHALGVIASDDAALLALLSSSAHYWWTIERASTLETRIRYTPTDVFETFVRPEPTDRLRDLGDRLDRERRELMLARQAGLTSTYNLVHDAACTDTDIVALRALHREIDEATFAAYGWTDLTPASAHHPTRQGVRWTVDPATRVELLDRLLELNQERYAAEQAQRTAAPALGLFP